MFLKSFLFSTFCVVGLAQATSQPESALEDPASKPSYFSALATRAYFYVSANTPDEQSKFPTMNISDLLHLIDPHKDKTVEGVLGANFEYETGSREGSRDSYKGIAYLESLDYGDAIHQFLGPDKGFSPTVDHRTLKNNPYPHPFLKDLDNFPLHKGTPYKGDDALTRVEYTGYNGDSTKYVKIILRRERL